MASSGSRTIYVDESGFTQDMPRTHGYSPRGQRCEGTHDWHAKGRRNVIGALLGRTLLSACLFNCTVDTEVFYAWLTQDLLPQTSTGAVIIMDNARFHLRQDIRQAIEQKGLQLQFLPVYSPDLNPIEHKWAQAKAIRRRTQCSVEEFFSEYKI